MYNIKVNQRRKRGETYQNFDIDGIRFSENTKLTKNVKITIKKQTSPKLNDLPFSLDTKFE